MSNAANPPSETPDHLRLCPSCQHKVPAEATFCPECGYPLAVRATDATTTHLERNPITVPLEATEPGHLPLHGNVILQLLPSGMCITLTLKKPLILGRAAAGNVQDVLDLSGFNALRHGVSRRHCKLERRDNRLFVTDIGSANGTYLNHAPLVPHRPYPVAHGDQLVLGSLHMFVAFSLPEE